MEITNIIASWGPPDGVGWVIVWKTGGFSLCADAQRKGINACWIEPRHSRMARILTADGAVEFNCADIALIGGYAKDLCEERQFWGGVPKLEFPNSGFSPHLV